MKRKKWVIAISAGFVLVILMIVLHFFGYLPQPLKVTAASNADEALLKALQSYKNWSSLQGEARLVQYDADGGNPQLETVSVEIVQPLKANVAFKASDVKANLDQRWVSDGKNIYQVNDGDLSYIKYNIPGFAKNLDVIPQTLADIKKGEVYNHPFAMLLSNPIMEYVYPVGFPQAPSGASYQLLGEENVAERTTWKVDLKIRTDHAVAWIDEDTGVILKYSQENDGGKKVVEMEFLWIKFDQNIDAQEFAPPDTGKYHPASSPASPALQQSTPTQNPIHATGTPSKDNSATIAKVLIQDQWKYYIANPDGSEPVLIYSGEQSPLMASLSPDATKFAYFLGNFVYIQDIKTGKTKPLNQDIIGSMGGQIRWSLDGTHIALECANAQQQTLAICLIDTQNGQIEVLVNEKNTDGFCSSSAAFIMLQDWSQDGSTMVYTCFILQGQGQKQDFSIYLYDLASKTSKRVFDGTTQDSMWGIGSVSISPDKKTLLITGNHQDYITQIFLFDLSNNTLKQLTNETDYDSEALVWRSDSRSFYLHKTFIQIPYPESNFVMDANGLILNSVEINGRIIK